MVKEHRLKAVVLALLAIGLAGCEAMVREFETLSENEPTQPVEAERVNVAMAAADPLEQAPAEPDADDESVVPLASPLPPRPESKPSVTYVAFEKLTGLTPRQSERLLGPPDHRSEDPPATVWTYEMGECRLEIFFYFDLESQQQRSLAYDVYTDSEAQGAEVLCLVQLAQRGERQRPLEDLLDGMNSELPSLDARPSLPKLEDIISAGEAHENGEDDDSE